MKGIPSIVLSEQTRKRLGFSCAILNLLCLVASLILVVLGAYIEIAVKTKLNLIKNYRGHYLPVLIIVIAVLLVGVNIFGWRICLDSRVVKRRRQQQTLFLAYVTISSLLSIVVEVTSILCFVHKNQLHASFTKGLRSAMNRYRTDHALKQEIDWLQLKYECCGNNAYTDWFSTHWIGLKYVDEKSKNTKRKMTSGKYLNDDVPFSCCNRHMDRPCIHHHVHDNNLHYNYDYKVNTTLNEGGCKHKLIDFYGNQVLKNVGIVIMVISIIQGVMCTATRFLQTSIQQTLYNKDPTGPAPGWLISTSWQPQPAETLEEEEARLLQQAGYNEDEDDGFASDEFDDDFEETTTMCSAEQSPAPEPFDDQLMYYNEGQESYYEQFPITTDDNQSAYRVIRRPTNRCRGSHDDNQSAYSLVPTRRLLSPPEPYRLSPRTARVSRSRRSSTSRRYQLVEEY